MRKTLQMLLKLLSEPDTTLDLNRSRHLTNLKAIDPFKKFYRTLDYKIYNNGYEVPFRVYFPEETSLDHYPVLLFFHGGGFVTESVENYNRICWNLAKHTNHVVVSVEYRLAPEYRFPTQIEDCYAVAKAIFQDETILHVKPEDITIIGDSAGGNLAAVVCQMARDRKEFNPQRQILIYPCTNNDYSKESTFPSVLENGNDYLLTRQNMEDYLNMYQSSEEDRTNPYFAPLLAEDFSDLPKALIITGEFDPLRDEGEAYAHRLEEAGVSVEHHRITDAIHGFFLLSPFVPQVKETYGYINDFLKEVMERHVEKKDKMEEP